MVSRPCSKAERPCRIDIGAGGDGALDGRLQPAPVEDVEGKLRQPDVRDRQQGRELFRAIDRGADAPDLALAAWQRQQRLPDRRPPRPRNARTGAAARPPASSGRAATGPVDGDMDALRHFAARSARRRARWGGSLVTMPSGLSGAERRADPMLAVAIAGGGIEVRDAGLPPPSRGWRAAHHRPACRRGWRCHRACRTARRPAPGSPAVRRPRSGQGRSGCARSAQRARRRHSSGHGAATGSARPARRGGHGAIVVQRVDGAAQVGQVEIVDTRDRRRIAAALPDDPGRDVLAVMRVAARRGPPVAAGPRAWPRRPIHTAARRSRRRYPA